MSDDYMTREDSGGPQVLDIISLYGQLQAVRIALRKHVNNLERSVEERKQLYADLKAKEAALTSAIAQQITQLDPSERQRLKAMYDQEPVCAT